MTTVIGFLLICYALIFFVTFTMAHDLLLLDKIKLCLAMMVFITVLAIGAYLLTENAII